MALNIISSALAANLSAAATQAAWTAALVAPWSGGNVTASIRSGAIERSAVTIGPMTINAVADPDQVLTGAYVSRAFASAGAADRVVLVASGVDQFEVTGITIADLINSLSRERPIALTFTAPSWLPSDSLPAWLGPVNEWTAITGSALTSSGAGWSGTPPGGTSNFQAVVNAWGGGCLNTVGIWRAGAFVAGTFLVIFGGGHGDYAGQELYAFGPLGSGSPTWSRITDPRIPAIDDVGRSGGYPVSRHTYDTLVYFPTTNQMLCIGAPGFYHTGFAFNQGDIFDFDLNPSSGSPWSTADVGFPTFNGGGTGTIDLVSAYDASTGAAWGLGKGNSQRLGRYTVSGGTWTEWTLDNPDSGVGKKAAIDPAHSVFAFVGNGGAVLAIDLRVPTASVYTPSTTGTGPGTRLPLCWDDAGGRFVGWTGTGKTLYILTPSANPYAGGSAWTWSSSTPPNGATPINETANGTYSRIQMVTEAGWRGVLLMPTATNDLLFYRMA